MTIRLAVAAATLALSTAAVAGDQAPPAPRADDTPDMSCASFRHAADGSWTPIRDLRMAGVTMPKDKPIRPGEKVAGIDLAAHLDQACKLPTT